MRKVPILDVVKDVSSKCPKLPSSAVRPSGSFAVVDQGHRAIAGYQDDPALVTTPTRPLIVFGDHTRAVKFVDFPFTVGADGVKVLAVNEAWDPNFVYHFLCANEVPSAGYSRHFKFLKELTVPWFPLSEQRRIAAILDQAQGMCDLQRQELAHLQELPLVTFAKAFGEVDAVIPLREAATFTSGATPSKSDPSLWAGSLPWFSAKDLKKSDLWDSFDHVSDDAPVRTSLKLLVPDTISVVVRGMILAHTFPVSVLRVPSTINQDLKAITAKNGFNTEYLAWALRWRAGWVLARTSSAAHGTARLATETLESIPIPAASRTAQSAFSEEVSAISRAADLATRRMAQLEAIRRTLAHRAFRGEL